MKICMRLDKHIYPFFQFNFYQQFCVCIYVCVFLFVYLFNNSQHGHEGLADIFPYWCLLRLLPPQHVDYQVHSLPH